MNKERLLQLADHLETPAVAEHFDMLHSIHAPDIMPEQEDNINVKDAITHCGAVACIGGWAVVLFNPDASYGETTAGDAQELLDLDDTQGYELFFSHTQSWITPKQAASVIRNLVETGEVDWEPVMEEQYPSTIL